MADRAKIIGPLRGSSPRQQACSGATPALRAVEPGFAFGPKKKAALNTRAAQVHVSENQRRLHAFDRRRQGVSLWPPRKSRPAAEELRLPPAGHAQVEKFSTLYCIRLRTSGVGIGQGHPH
jgi:hypothetical protein